MKARNLACLTGVSAMVLALAGCGNNGVASTVTPVTTPTPTPTSSAGDTYLYLNEVNLMTGINTPIFPANGNGSLAPVTTANGSAPSVDSAGNLYTVSFPGTAGAVNEYAAGNLTGNPIRTIPIGSGSQLAGKGGTADALASPSGEILISDGVGVAVFNAKATGNVAPDRYIRGTLTVGGGTTPVTPGMITVDSSDNIYVANTTDNASIVMYGPTANGTVTPTRVISGALTGMSPGYVSGLAVDSTGDLYVLCSCTGTDGYHFKVLEFGPGASGNVAPIRQLYADKENPYDQIGDGNGMALGSDGTLYVASGDIQPSSVYIYAPGASGNDAPVRIITSTAWADVGWSAASARIAVH